MKPDHDAAHLSLPAVEWIPLDGLIQTWATAVVELPQPEALQATSEALRALALETSARRCYYNACTVRAWDQPAPELVGQHLSLTLTDLFEAHRHWGLVAEWLERLARECRQEQAHYPLLRDLFAALSTHQGYLCRLLARLAEEAVPVTVAMQQAMARTLAVAFCVTEQEGTV